jgi:hypothetical protein
MNLSTDSHSPQRHEDAGIEELLREVGARDEPSAEMGAAVRQAVHAQWRAMVQARARRRSWGLALAAGVVGIATAAIAIRISPSEPVAVATIVRIEGHPQVEAAGQVHEARLGEVLAIGMRLQTTDARVAVNFGNDSPGISVRVDSGSQLRFTEPQRIDLTMGTLYVDAGEHGAALTVATAAGSVQHVGTQYQVRTVGGSKPGIEVSIREGRVEIASKYGTNTGIAGERVAVSTSGSVLRDALPAYDESWRWASSVAPPFEIAGRSLEAFLQWVARETGRELAYDSSAAQRAAAAMVLGGSIAGLEPEKALEGVLTTTKLERLESPAAALRIAIRRD